MDKPPWRQRARGHVAERWLKPPGAVVIPLVPTLPCFVRPTAGRSKKSRVEAVRRPAPCPLPADGTRSGSGSRPLPLASRDPQSSAPRLLITGPWAELAATYREKFSRKGRRGCVQSVEAEPAWFDGLKQLRLRMFELRATDVAPSLWREIRASTGTPWQPPKSGSFFFCRLPTPGAWWDAAGNVGQRWLEDTNQVATDRMFAG